ncbi:MAG: hypothetical protein PHE67_07155 [Campylobacterales bacterium]|nr:hypothetical protein [Campylobacterales bacterium]
MAKYKYDWLIEQYKQELGCISGDTLEALVAFIELNRSRVIYYDLAMLFFYKKPIWYIKITARLQVRQAIKHTALAGFEDVIVKKILTDAKAKTLQTVDYYAFDWRGHYKSNKSSKTNLASLIKDKITKILHVKA